MRLALFEPEIPQNTGAILRLAACFNVSVDIIEPCGFIFSDRLLKRSGMDYIGQADMKIHKSWENFFSKQREDKTRRIILLTTKAKKRYTDFKFFSSDILLLGNESSGAPVKIHEAADDRILIPITAKSRSLNIVTSAAIVVGEALRQTDTYPK